MAECYTEKFYMTPTFKNHTDGCCCRLRLPFKKHFIWHHFIQGKNNIKDVCLFQRLAKKLSHHIAAKLINYSNLCWRFCAPSNGSILPSNCRLLMWFLQLSQEIRRKIEIGSTFPFFLFGFFRRLPFVKAILKHGTWKQNVVHIHRAIFFIQYAISLWKSCSSCNNLIHLITNYVL